MDELALIENHLAAAQQHVADGARHVALQRKIVGDLESAGHDKKMARKLLALFEQSLALHLADLDRVRRERVL